MKKIYNNISSVEFLTALNVNKNELCERWDCHTSCFVPFENEKAASGFISTFNRNLRKLAIKPGMCGNDFITQVNQAFDNEERRFQDYIGENVIPREGASIGEPTALVSPDGTKLEVWCTEGYAYSEDGYNFSQFQSVTREVVSDYPSPQCFNYFYHNGELYCTSTYNGFNAFLLWKQNASNLLHFDFVQVLFEPGYTTGNSFIFEDGGYFYLIYEGDTGGSSGGWKTFIAKASSLTGQYENIINTPIIYTESGNPELATIDNRVYKCDGKYYMFFHHKITNENERGIWRAYSTDLINWVVEGPLLDGKILPAYPSWSNGDQSLCEFKEHSYLFVTNNANRYLDPHPNYYAHIDMYIDYRPFSEILRLEP